MANFDLAFYFSLFRKRLPLALAVVALAGFIGVLVTYSLPPVYRATAKLLVESPQIPIALAKSTVPTEVSEQFQIIQEDVLSRESLLALADRFAIYRDRAAMGDLDVAEDMRGRIVIEPVQAQGPGNAAVYNISFDARAPDLAANVTNELVSMILRKDVELRTSRAADTAKFFTQETQRLDVALKALDSQILQFKNEHIDALPDSLDFRRGQQTAQQQTLLLLTQEEATLRRRQSDLASNRLLPGSLAASPEERSLDELRGSLFTQLAVFSESSPVIRSLRARISSLEAQIRGDKTAASDEEANSSRPALSSADLELASISDRLKVIAEQKAAIAKSNDELTASILATPTNETALNAMVRNENNIQEQYNSAVTRLAEASTGEQIELRLKGERLSLIESAVPPQAPVSPKFKVLLGATGALSLLLGAAVLAVPELLNKSIRRPVELINRLDIRPMITVPYITTAGERHKRRLTSMAVFVAILAAIPLLLLGLHTYVPPVNAFMGKTLGGIATSEGNSNG